MTTDYQGKVAVVTGATSGIGLATARLFAERGANVVMAARREKLGQRLAAEIRNGGRQATFIRTDVAEASSVANLFEQTLKVFGSIDFSFNNAGIAGENLKDTSEQTEANWDQVININLRGVWLCMKHALAIMRRQNSGAVVNTASMYAHVASEFGIAPYVASKHGILGLTRSAAVEFAKYGIRVNAISPGPTRSDMTAPAMEGFPDAFNALIRQHVPLGRIGEPTEIAEAVVWLCSSSASYVTGQTLIVDGGWLAH